MSTEIETSKKRRVLRRILENTEIYTEKELSTKSTQELFRMQDILLIKLIIKNKFHRRNSKMPMYWN